MRVMSSTPSPVVADLDWAHIYFWAFLYYFLELLGAHDFLKEAQSQRIKILYYFIVPRGHPEGVSQTLLGPTMCFHLFLVEWVTFFGWVSPL